MRPLIADDDRALGGFMARGPEQDGHEVTVATDGGMAIEAVRRDLPEIAVLDLNLPRWDGTEVLEYLRSLAEDVPILILTARQEPEKRLKCLEMGADDFMQKPFSFAELQARCRMLLLLRSPI
jgi:DNA-binding response OmpR family regulator